MSSLRDDETRRLSFDQHEADLARWAAIDRVIEMTPAVGEPSRRNSCWDRGGSPTAPPDRDEEST